MSAISDFAAKQQAHNDAMKVGLDGLQGDIEALNLKIEELQTSPGTATPEDQALLDQLEAQGAALAGRVTTLDEMTPPVPPTA